MLDLVFDDLIDVGNFEELLDCSISSVRPTMMLMRSFRHARVTLPKPTLSLSDRMTAIEMCINRSDEDTKQSFRDLYTKVSMLRLQRPRS